MAPPPKPHPEPIAFTGVGDPRHFPVNDLYKAIQTVIRRDGNGAWQYGDMDDGYPPLRPTISHILASQGIQAQPALLPHR
jgi:GntR family transcriptional regulator / MocR family aminotransferase